MVSTLLTTRFNSLFFLTLSLTEYGYTSTYSSTKPAYQLSTTLGESHPITRSTRPALAFESPSFWTMAFHFPWDDGWDGTHFESKSSRGCVTLYVHVHFRWTGAINNCPVFSLHGASPRHITPRGDRTHKPADNCFLLLRRFRIWLGENLPGKLPHMGWEPFLQGCC